MSARLRGRVGWQIVLARRNPLQVRGELLVAKDLTLGLAQHVGQAPMLRSQQERAITTALDKLVGASDARLS